MRVGANCSRTVFTWTLLLSLTGCAAGNSTFQPARAKNNVEWSLDLCHGDAAGVRGRLLKQPDGSWKYQPGAWGKVASGAEGVAVDAAKHAVCLDLPDPPHGNCPHGLLGAIDRSDDEYASAEAASACNSELVDCELEWLPMPLTAIMGSYVCDPRVSEKFSSAVESSNAVYLSYRQQFDGAAAPEEFEAFAKSHTDFDPDNLVPKAAAKATELRQNQQLAEQEERAAAKRQFEAALNLMDENSDPALNGVATAHESVAFIRERVADRFDAKDPCVYTTDTDFPTDAERVATDLRAIELTEQVEIRGPYVLEHTELVQSLTGNKTAELFGVRLDHERWVVAYSRDDATRVVHAFVALAQRCGNRLDARFR